MTVVFGLIMWAFIGAAMTLAAAFGLMALAAIIRKYRGLPPAKGSDPAVAMALGLWAVIGAIGGMGFYVFLT